MEFNYPKTPSPLRIKVVGGEQTSSFWNVNPIIYFIVSGEAYITTPDAHILLHGGDIHTVNAYNIHSCDAAGGRLIALEIDIPYFERILQREMNSDFFCNSAISENKEDFIPLRTALAHYLLRALESQSEDNGMLLISLSCRIMHILQNSFSLRGDGRKAAKLNKYAANALTYMNTNYSTIANMHEVAERCHIADSYLARLFKDYLGVGPATYLESVRLSHAVAELVGGNKTISEIAAGNGFPSARAFSSAFRERYKVLPSAYRARHIMRSRHRAEDRGEAEAEALLSLLKTMASDDMAVSEAKQNDMIIMPEVDAGRTGSAMENGFFDVLYIGNAAALLHQPMDQILGELDRISFKYAYIMGVFGEQMLVSTRSELGPVYYFNNIDMAIDLLLSHNLRPFINMSGMPVILAEDKAAHHSNSMEPAYNMPGKMEEWCDLVNKFLAHLSKRYGIESLRTWRFVTWTYPYDPSQMRMEGTSKDFLDFYKKTFMTVRNFDPEILFGSTPYCSPSREDKMRWFRDYISFCKENDCTPDFLCFYVDLPIKTLPDGDTCAVAGGATDSLQMLADSLSPVLDEYFPHGIDVIVNEWFPFSYSTNYLGDTISCSAYLAKSFARHHSAFLGVAFSPISDYLDKYNAGGNEFYGYTGLLSKSGIRKPSLTALWLLSRMGDRELYRGDGFLVSKKGRNLYILLYNPTDISALLKLSPGPDFWYAFRNMESKYYLDGKPVHLSINDRSAVYEGRNRTFRLPVFGLEDINYEMSIFTISKNHGNVIEIVNACGGEPIVRKWEIDRLKNLTTWGYYRKIITPQNGRYNIEKTLEPNDFVLITLEAE